MTQEEKQLLLKDLCARLPYETFVRIEVDGNVADKKLTIDFFSSFSYHLEFVKPYLRPMSSMTKEEIDEYHKHCEFNDCDYTGEPMYFDTIDSFDYLYSIHVDCRGLIPKSLALEAPEGMYKV